MSAAAEVPQEALFPFIRSGQPFYEEVRRFGDIVQGSTAYQHQRERASAGLPVAVHTEIKGIQSHGGWKLQRFYHSIQFPHAGLPGGHYGWSLHYAEADGPRVVEFPEDPKLSSLQGFISQAEAGSIRILRYVPLRRVTFLASESGESAAHIGKLKKLHRCREGFLRLDALARRADESGIRIPKALAMDENHGVFLQERVPGDEVTLALSAANHVELMEGIGELHARLHCIETSGLPRWDRDGVLANLNQDLDWIAAFLSEAQPLLGLAARRLVPWLQAREPDEACFCHGDFACSQILLHGEGWSVVDFDLAGVGDRYQDIAMFLVSLAYDVPLYMEQAHLMAAARDAYLAGYERAAPLQAVKPAVLRNYEACAEIYYLALVLRKDRYEPDLGERALDRLEQILEKRHD